MRLDRPGFEMLCEGLASSSDDFLVALDTAGSIVWADPLLLGALGRAAGAHLHVDQFLEGDDLTAVSRAMGRLLSDRPERLEEVLRIRAAGRSPRVRVTGAWRLDFKDGASVVVGFLRLEDGVGPAN